jgi:hypothetical protein
LARPRPATKGEEGTIKAHSHAFDETVAFVGSDPQDPYDLGGEIEFWVDGKKRLSWIKASWPLYLPGPFTAQSNG